MSNLMPFEEKKLMAQAVAKSGLFGLRSEDQALVLMGICESTGLHPMRAAQDYHIINNKPALTADAMLARFQDAGGKVRWTCYTDDKVEGAFSHPQGGELTVEWTINRARNAGLSSPTWKKFPRNMLRARVASEAIRALLPGIVSGLYTPEEVADFEPVEVKRPKEVKSGQATEEQVKGFHEACEKGNLKDMLQKEELEEIKKGITKARLNGIYKALGSRKKAYDEAKEITIKPEEESPAEKATSEMERRETELEGMMGDRPE